MRSTVDILNLAIILTSIVLSVMNLMQVVLDKTLDRSSGRHFRFCFVGLLLYSCAILAGLLLRGRTGWAGYRAILYAANFLEFLLSGMLVYIITHYLLVLTDPNRNFRRLRLWLALLAAVHAVLLIVSQFTGLYYTIDASNVYHRSALYPLSYVCTVLMMLTGIFLLVRCRALLSRRERSAFWIYYLIPLVMMSLQIFLYGFYFVLLGTIVAAMAMYLFILSEQTDQLVRRDTENAQMKVDILLSQIQPHFLYNSLLVIRQICLSDPQKAADALSEFTKYVRHNMDSLTADAPIPFSAEMEHVKRYVELQKLRFGDALTVDYELACTDFSVPTLTVQPLVENAIRHGVRKNADGRGHDPQMERRLTC